MTKLDENWLANQRRALEEVRRLTDRLEGALCAAVRVTAAGQLSEAKELTEIIEHEMKALRNRIKDDFE